MEETKIVPENLWSELIKRRAELDPNLKNGFSWPFVIGAYYLRGFITQEDLKSDACIRKVLTYVTENATAECEAMLCKCGMADKQILQFLNENRTPNEIEMIKKSNPNINHLYLELDFGDFSKIPAEERFDSVVAKLWKKYSTGILEREQFSRGDVCWQGFSLCEKEFIMNL